MGLADQVKEKFLTEIKTAELLPAEKETSRFDGELLNEQAENITKEDLIKSLLMTKKVTEDILSNVTEFLQDEFVDGNKIPELSRLIDNLIKINKTIYDIKFKVIDDSKKGIIESNKSGKEIKELIDILEGKINGDK